MKERIKGRKEERKRERKKGREINEETMAKNTENYVSAPLCFARDANKSHTSTLS